MIYLHIAASLYNVYTFAPYESKERVEKIIGFRSKNIQKTVSENMTQLLFVKNKKVVCSICGYPEDLGYSFSFGSFDGDYLSINNGDNAVFAVKHMDGYVDLTLLQKTTTIAHKSSI